MRILVASYNLHKIKEIKNIFSTFDNLDVELISPASLVPEIIDVEETGNTFAENAYLKSNFWFNKTGVPSISDDSGLEIDSLDNMPGVNSARFSGVHGDNSANRKKVLELMKEIPDDKRGAQFRCVTCLSMENKVLYFEGICRGKITYKEVGLNGFGYDPIFIPDGFDVTFAQMKPEQKNSLSHRGKAIRHLADYLMKVVIR